MSFPPSNNITSKEEQILKSVFYTICASEKTKYKSVEILKSRLEALSSWNCFHWEVCRSCTVLGLMESFSVIVTPDGTLLQLMIIIIIHKKWKTCWENDMATQSSRDDHRDITSGDNVSQLQLSRSFVWRKKEKKNPPPVTKTLKVQRRHRWVKPQTLRSLWLYLSLAGSPGR